MSFATNDLYSTTSNVKVVHLQEQKEIVFNNVKTVIETLEVLSNIARKISYDKEYR